MKQSGLAQAAAAGLGAAACCIGALRASASDAETRWDNARDLGVVAVRERTHEEFQTEGIRIGNYYLFPEIGYGASWSSDSSRAATGPARDIRHETMTRMALVSSFARHQLDILVEGRGIARSGQDDTSYVDGKVRAVGRIDIDHRLSLFGSALWQLRHEDNLDDELPRGARTAPSTTTLRTEAGLQWRQGRIDAAVGLRYERADFDSYVANDGTTVDQSARNFQAVEPFARAGWSISPGYRLFAEVSGRHVEMEGAATLNRNSETIRGSAGLELELTRLVKVVLLAGYRHEDLAQPTLSDIDGFVWSARVDWYATPLMTVSLLTSRDVASTTFGDAAGRIVTTHAIRADYEVLRNLIVSAEGRLVLPEYIGVDRQDQILIGRLGIDYSLNKHWVLSLSAEHQQLTSSIGELDRTLERLGVGIKYRF